MDGRLGRPLPVGGSLLFGLAAAARRAQGRIDLGTDDRAQLADADRDCRVVLAATGHEAPPRRGAILGMRGGGGPSSGPGRATVRAPVRLRRGRAALAVRTGAKQRTARIAGARIRRSTRRLSASARRPDSVRPCVDRRIRSAASFSIPRISWICSGVSRPARIAVSSHSRASALYLLLARVSVMPATQG